jgi:hypothetical protein
MEKVSWTNRMRNDVTQSRGEKDTSSEFIISIYAVTEFSSNGYQISANASTKVVIFNMEVTSSTKISDNSFTLRDLIT